MQEIADINLLAGWVGMLLGVVSGAVIGLFFHREDWMGGYSSFRRRLARLGHIAFFGIGFLNFFFALTIINHPVPAAPAQYASVAMIVALATMSPCCFLTAWKKEPFRHLFPVPVLAASTGIVLLLANW